MTNNDIRLSPEHMPADNGIFEGLSAGNVVYTRGGYKGYYNGYGDCKYNDGIVNRIYRVSLETPKGPCSMQYQPVDDYAMAADGNTDFDIVSVDKEKFIDTDTSAKFHFQQNYDILSTMVGNQYPIEYFDTTIDLIKIVYLLGADCQHKADIDAIKFNLFNFINQNKNNLSIDALMNYINGLS